MQDYESESLLLSDALERYAKALAALEEASNNLSETQVLEVLVNRDLVRAALTQQSQSSIENITQVIGLDERLKQQAKLIASIGKLEDWRASLNPPAEAWWWFFEKPKLDLWNRFDPVLDGLTVVFLTAFVSFMTTLTPRFAVGGLDLLNAFGLVGSGTVASLVLGSITQSGRQTLQKISPRYASEISFTVSALLLLGAIGVNASLPKIANYYYEKGKKSFEKDELKQAENEFKQSIALDPEKAQAHFWLGRTYEYKENYDSARTEYKLALQSNSPDAYNNLGRLYIEDGKPFLAETYIAKGLGLAHNDSDWKINYTLLKNLGWAQMEQKRYKEAQKNLERAIQLSNRQPLKDRYWDAHCVLAEVMVRQGNQKGALPEAKLCIDKGYFANASDYRWYILASRHLGTAEAGSSKKLKSKLGK